MDLYSLPQLPPNFDSVGIFYITFCATWSTLVLGGMIFLYVNRRNPILKIRGLPLSFAAIVLLHAYWILAQITYPIGQTIPIVLAYDIQYFFMGLWFPLGIALFHASNSRFLYIAEQQKQFVHSDHRRRLSSDGAKSCWLCRLRNLAYPTKILAYIVFGMIFQVRCALPLLLIHDCHRRCLNILLGPPYCRHVVRVLKIPPDIRHSWYRTSRDA